MAKTKAELLEEAKKLGIEVPSKATIADITKLIAEAPSKDEAVEETTEGAKPATEAVDEPQVAKAGKRSAKSLKEAEEKQAKEERKASGEAAEQKPKAPVTPTRSRLERRAKGYRKAAEQIQKGKAYTLEEAVVLAQKSSTVKFDATVELHINLGVDPRHADQNIRDNLVLPAGTGKKIRIAVFSDDAVAAKKAGADIAGVEEIAKQLDKGVIDFDVLIANPASMPKLGKYARTLGPRGLMPNPKSGTVAADVVKAVSEAKAGKVEYRVDKQATIHLSIGKVSFGAAKLIENAQSFFGSLQSQKPSSLKGIFIKSTSIATTMGPGIKVENQAN